LGLGALGAASPHLGTQWGPVLEWSLEDHSFHGAPFDVPQLVMYKTPNYFHTRDGMIDADTRVLTRDHTQTIYYRQDATSIRLDLSELRRTQIAIAVDTKKAYEEIRVEAFSPGKHLWKAPYRSDWALAIGSWRSPD